MMKPLALITLLSLLASFESVFGDEYVTDEHPNSIMHHSLNPPYIMDWWEGGLAYWDFGGSTVVTDECIRLTPDREARSGWLWNEYAISLDSWHVRFGFTVHGKNKFGADGFALWYVERPHRGEGRVFGMHNRFNGVGFIFDTYDNNANRDTPSISLISNDGSYHNFDFENDLQPDALGRCGIQLRNRKDIEIDIFYEKKKISLFVSVPGKDPFECISVSDLELPERFYFGLTAATGQLSDNHDINFFHFYPLAEAHLHQNPYEIDYDEDIEDEIISLHHRNTAGNEPTEPKTQVNQNLPPDPHQHGVDQNQHPSEQQQQPEAPVPLQQQQQQYQQAPQQQYQQPPVPPQQQQQQYQQPPVPPQQQQYQQPPVPPQQQQQQQQYQQPPVPPQQQQQQYQQPPVPPQQQQYQQPPQQQQYQQSPQQQQYQQPPVPPQQEQQQQYQQQHWQQ